MAILTGTAMDPASRIGREIMRAQIGVLRKSYGIPVGRAEHYDALFAEEFPVSAVTPQSKGAIIRAGSISFVLESG
jgi:hypothetical protein